MNIIKTRPRREIRKQLEDAKEEVYIFNASRGKGEDQDITEAYYHYWRGVRNALIWVYYPGAETPIRSDKAWELGKEPLPPVENIEEHRARLRQI